MASVLPGLAASKAPPSSFLSESCCSGVAPSYQNTRLVVCAVAMPANGIERPAPSPPATKARRHILKSVILVLPLHWCFWWSAVPSRALSFFVCRPRVVGWFDYSSPASSITVCRSPLEYETTIRAVTLPTFTASCGACAGIKRDIPGRRCTISGFML